MKITWERTRRVMAKAREWLKNQKERREQQEREWAEIIQKAQVVRSQFLGFFNA